MSDMEDLEQLVAFAKKGTLSGAARSLHMSQPSLSRTMRRLESEFKVPLFDRDRNTIALNENGEMAVEYASRLLAMHDEMMRHVREYDRSRHTIAVASCAPAPLWEASRILSQMQPDMTVSSEMKSDDDMLEGVSDGTYRMVILNNPAKGTLEELSLIGAPLMTETLYLAVPQTHPLARFDEMRFKDFNGYNILLLNGIGFWEDVCREHLPASRLLRQSDSESFVAIAQTTDLLYFVTKASMRIYERPVRDRKLVRITDADATAEFHCVCRADDAGFLNAFVTAVAARP
ncbi:LysR family transcriptional regulator [Bifidobacterium lemurum]|nr:LysR family transcriptional regulator [Bifidobacterium lemurum]